MSLSDWHRRQHKKQQQKNKAARIAQRDAAAVETKTSAGIQHDIRELLRRHKNAADDESLLPHAVKSKLDRLRKELRLVQQEEQKRKDAQGGLSSSARPPPPSQPAFQPLEHPQVSVYYDALLNPYGAPPPGQPMLYHRRGGGVTPHLSDAWIPGQPDAFVSAPANSSSGPPPPGTNPSPYNHRPPPPPAHCAIAQSGAPHPPPPPPQLVPPPPPPPPPPPSLSHSDRRPRTVKPSAPDPPIPEHRPRRKIRNVWAEEDERELVEQVEAEAAFSVHGEVAAPSSALPGKSTAPSDSDGAWLYRDTSGVVQGPFPTSLLLQWVHAGFFPSDTPVIPSAAAAGRREEGDWSTMSGTPPFAEWYGPCGHDGDSTTAVATADSSLVADDRASEDEEANGIQARIAALKASSAVPLLQPVDPPPRSPTDVDNDEADGVQARIQALKASSTLPMPHPVAPPQRSRADRDSDERDEDEEEGDSVQDRIRALRAESARSSLGAPPEGDRDEPGKPVPLRPSDAGRLLLPPPPPPPKAAANYCMPMYPVPNDDGNDLGAYGDYPVSDDPADAYPIADATDDAAYPVFDAYPVGDDDNDDVAYPVIDKYPDDADEEANELPHPSLPEAGGSTTAKRRYQADREVVSLLPTHLQSKRRRTANPHRATSPATASRTPSSTTTGRRLALSDRNNNSNTDDLDRLFREIGDDL